MEEKTCKGIIDLSRPFGKEQRRAFQPPWYTVYHYHCPLCGRTCWVRATSFRGRYAEPSKGAIRCSAPPSALP